MSITHNQLKQTEYSVQDLRPDQPRRYDMASVDVKDKAAMAQQIAEGWEIALQTKDTVFFRRPRWVP